MLENIHGLSDLKKLNIADLPALCEDIRKKTLEVVHDNGGHLASNLGVVELTVALHYVFDEQDKIVWDVGHQSYIHKLLTGRGARFETLRQEDGISGFPDREEDPSDVFGAGHASTSISAALGIATARDILKQDYNVVAVIGDGALTGGLSYEGLNSIGQTKMLVVLNDNNMSIDKNVGSATKNLSRVRVRKGYLNFKHNTKRFLNALPLIGKPLLRLSKRIVRNIRLSKLHNIYFENFNMKYIGPINGHDIKDLIYYLQKIKDNVSVPTVLHVLTQKGHGFVDAENDPQKYHALAPKNSDSSNTMSQIVGKTLADMAENGEKVVAICAAMTSGTGLTDFAEKFPQRFFDVGIAEEHAVTFSAGLACMGMKPFVAIYSTFLQRAYDQILHDVCIQKLPITFCIDRAGFVGEDGKTHQGLFDIAYLSSMPNMTLLAPVCPKQLEEMLRWSLDKDFPIALRYPRNAKEMDFSFDFGHWKTFGDVVNSKAVIFAVGPNAYAESSIAVEQLNSAGTNCGLVCVDTIKPLDVATLLSVTQTSKLLVTVEEGVENGGVASLFDLFLAEKNIDNCKIVHIGVDDQFVKHAAISRQLFVNGISAENIKKTILENL